MAHSSPCPFDHLSAFCSATETEPAGILVLHHRGEDGAWGIVRADPKVEFTDELLWAIYTDDEQMLYPPGLFEFITIPTGFRFKSDGHLGPDWKGNLLRLNGSNRTVVYKIHEYVWVRHRWVARWPD